MPGSIVLRPSKKVLLSVVNQPLTQDDAGDVDWVDDVAQEGPLDTRDSPVGQLVAAGHAADAGGQGAGAAVGHGPQRAFHMDIGLDGRIRL